MEKEAHAQAEAQKEKDEAEVQVNGLLRHGCDMWATRPPVITAGDQDLPSAKSEASRSR